MGGLRLLLLHMLSFNEATELLWCLILFFVDGCDKCKESTPKLDGLRTRDDDKARA